ARAHPPARAEAVATAPATAATAWCCSWRASWVTSRSAATSTSPVSSASAPTATTRKARARRAPSGPSRRIRLVIPRHAEAVPGAEDGLDDARVLRIALDLAAQVLHVRVDGARVARELVAASPVDLPCPR